MKIRTVTWEGALPEADAGNTAQTAGLLMDDEKFTGFYQRTARPLWAYLARVSGNAALADDLLQESYLRLLCASFVADGEVSCRRYLFRIASNLMRDHWRRPMSESLEDLPEGALAADDSRASERIDSKALLGRAFMRLRPRERQLLWLAYAEGVTHREIAEITGLGATSIRLLLFRARRKLARLLRIQNAGPGRNA
jgi:RNA polymerase sigma-70 factor (ECF subfamily)